MMRINKHLQRINQRHQLQGQGQKKVKEAFNGIIQDIWAKTSIKITTSYDRALINVTHAKEGVGSQP